MATLEGPILSNGEVNMKLGVWSRASLTVRHSTGTKYKFKTTPTFPLASPLAATSGYAPLPPTDPGPKAQEEGGHCATDGCPLSSQPSAVVPEGPWTPLSAALPIDRTPCHPQACHEFFIKSL